MSYISHINKFVDAQAIQSALDAGTLVNPYVAMTTAGTLDYNTLSPTPPAPSTMGVWTEPEQNTHAFQITETGTTYWEQPVKIGVLNDVYMDGNQDSPDVMLSYNTMDDTWYMQFASQIASDQSEYSFEIGVPYTWESGAMTDPDDSDAVITVGWDGTGIFTFQTGDLHPITMTTIDPPYPEVSGE